MLCGEKLADPVVIRIGLKILMRSGELLAVVDFSELDRLLKVATPFILTDEEQQRVSAIEQKAYEKNLLSIHPILDDLQSKLNERKFWTENQVNTQGLRFRYSLRGFYGPGGFTSQMHVAGLLVLGRIDPKGDHYAGFYTNDLEKNTFIGERYDELAFIRFIEQDLTRYLAPGNQILSTEQSEWIQRLRREK